MMSPPQLIEATLKTRKIPFYFLFISVFCFLMGLVAWNLFTNNQQFTKPRPRVQAPVPLQKQIGNNFAIYISSSTEKQTDDIKFTDNSQLQPSSSSSSAILKENSINNSMQIPPAEGDQLLESMCSIKATKYGTGQKVVSFALFKKKYSEDQFYVRYLPGIQINLKEIRKVYPGWIMRLYTDLNLGEYGILKELEDHEPDFFICNTTSLPGIGNVSDGNGMVWRFFPIGDPTVDFLMVRDLDSGITSREASAVKQWLESDKVFHTMRDHPQHGTYVMGGLWGAKNAQLDNKTRQELLRRFFEQRFGKDDQQILSAVLYYDFKSKFMIHDSYLCERYKDSIPFPKRRTDLGHFVGATFRPVNTTVDPCPIACRPSYGKDWTYC